MPDLGYERPDLGVKEVDDLGSVGHDFRSAGSAGPDLGPQLKSHGNND